MTGREYAACPCGFQKKAIYMMRKRRTEGNVQMTQVPNDMPQKSKFGKS
jgi:hypothetical protein